MKEKQFETIEGIQAAGIAILKVFPDEVYLWAFDAWKSLESMCLRRRFSIVTKSLIHFL